MVFPAVMYGCDSWTIRKAECQCFQTVVLEKTLASHMDSKEIKPVHPKGNQPWTFIGRTDAETEAPILWPPDVKSQLIRKDPDTEKGRRQEEKGTTEDEMVGWHHQLSGHEFEQAPGKWWKTGSLAYCSPWGRRESDTTEWLNNNNYKLGYRHIESFYGGFIFDVILIIWRHFSYILRHITYLFDSWPPLFWSQILKSNKILLLENTFWETKIAKYLYFFSLNLFTKLITVC